MNAKKKINRLSIESRFLIRDYLSNKTDDYLESNTLEAIADDVNANLSVRIGKSVTASSIRSILIAMHRYTPGRKRSAAGDDGESLKRNLEELESRLHVLENDLMATLLSVGGLYLKLGEPFTEEMKKMYEQYIGEGENHEG